MTVTQERPRRVPTTTRGHHQHAVAGVVGEAEAAEADQAGAGRLTSSRTTAAPATVLPPVGGVGEPVGARGPAAGRHAPGDHALAAAQPGHRLVRGQQVQQVAGSVSAGDDLDGAGDESAGGTSVVARGLVTTKEPTW